jgi:hypothetical protein
MFEGYGLHSKAKFLDEKKQSKFLANLEGLTVLGKILKADPFKKLLSTVNFSREWSSAGPRPHAWANDTLDEGTKGKIEIMYEEIRHHNSNITVAELEEIFVNQDGKCYWSRVPLIAQTNGTTGYSLSMSPDRLDNSGKIWGDYTKNNIVITTQFANRGRVDINPEDIAHQCRQLGWEPMWFTDPRRDYFLSQVKEDPSLLKTARKKGSKKNERK